MSNVYPRYCFPCVSQKGVIRIYDIPDSTFETSDEEESEDEEEEGEQKGTVGGILPETEYVLACCLWQNSISLKFNVMLVHLHFNPHSISRQRSFFYQWRTIESVINVDIRI